LTGGRRSRQSAAWPSASARCRGNWFHRTTFPEAAGTETLAPVREVAGAATSARLSVRFATRAKRSPTPMPHVPVGVLDAGHERVRGGGGGLVGLE